MHDREYLIEHVRSRRYEIGVAIASIAFAAVFFGTILWISWEQWEARVFGSLALMLANGLMAFHLAQLCLSKSGFVCRLDREFLECHVPIAYSGDSFRVAVQDIVEIRRGTSGDSTRIEIVDRGGSVYWLTSNFGNPHLRIARILAELNPSIHEVQV